MASAWLLARDCGAAWDYHLIGPEGTISRELSADKARANALLAQAGGRGFLLGHADAPLAKLPLEPREALRQVAATGAWQILPRFWQDKPASQSTGEELLLVGALAIAPKFDGTIIIRGASHALWASVSAGEVVGLQPSLSPLLRQKILPLSFGESEHPHLYAAAAETMSRPERLSLLLGNLEAQARAQRLSPEAQAALVAGWLFGAELAATKAWWLGQNLMLISDQADGAVEICANQGLSAYTLGLERALIAGLDAISPL